MYINPSDKTKEQWLKENGVIIQEELLIVCAPLPGLIYVCLLFNDNFTAGGVVYSENELEAFKYPDGRYKIWFVVPIKSLIENSSGITEIDKTILERLI